MIAYNRVVDAFTDAGLLVHDNGRGQAQAQAPGHSPADRSVVITRIEGSVLIHSHSDPTAEVLATLGLSQSDLFDVPLGWVGDYPDGRRVHRTPDKKFRQSGNTAGTALFRADRLADATCVYMVEGEKDVLAAEAIGLVACCTAMGAGKAHLFDLTPLHGKRVVIVRDKDKPGHAHAEQLVDLLDDHASVTLAEARIGKDMADHVAAGFGADDLIEVSSSKKPSSDVAVAKAPGRRARTVCAASIRTERQRWFWDSKIPTGTIAMFAGKGGEGKTAYAIELAARVTRGELPGEYFGTPSTVLIWSGEDPFPTVINPRATVAGADLTKVFKLEIESYIDEDTSEVTPRLPADLDLIRSAIDDTAARLVIIDPIASVTGGDLNKEADVRRTLDGLARIAAATDTVILCVRHFGKGAGNASDKMSGSHAFRDAARSVFLFATDDETGHRVVSQDKGNYSADSNSSIAFGLESVDVCTDDGQTVSIGRVVIHGESEVSVGDIINRTPAGEASAARDDEARLIDRWLLKFLEAGPVGANDLYAAAEASGFSKDKAKRSKARINRDGDVIEAVRPENPGPWFWQLAGSTEHGSSPTAPVSVLPAPCKVRGGEAGSREHREQSAASAEIPLAVTTNVIPIGRTASSAPRACAICEKPLPETSKGRTHLDCALEKAARIAGKGDAS